MPVEFTPDRGLMMPSGVDPTPAPASPSLGETTREAFSTNLFAMGADLLMRERFNPVEGYNPLDDIRDTNYEANYRNAFVGARSPDEVQSIKSRIDAAEHRDRTIAAAGPTGLILSFAAGVLDPTVLIPGGILATGPRLARAAVSARNVGGSAAAGAAIWEGAARATDPTRTDMDTAITIGASTLLGGILGGAIGAASRGELAALAGRMGEFQDGFRRETNTGLVDEAGDVRAGDLAPQPIILADDFAGGGVTAGGGGGAGVPGSLGAAANVRGGLELERATGGAEQRLAFLNPVSRLQTSGFDSARAIVRDLSDAGSRYAENWDGVATSLGGTVETRIKMRYAPLAQSIKVLDDAFARYWFDTPDTTRMQRATAATRSEVARITNRTGGRMTYLQFKEEVGRAMRSGDTHENPFVAETAKAFRSQVFDPLKRDAIAQRLLPENVKAPGAESYLTRVYNREKIIARRDQFRSVLVNWLEAGQRGAERRLQELGNRRGERAFEVEQTRTRIAQEVDEFFTRRGSAREERARVAAEARGAQTEFNQANREAGRADAAEQRDSSRFYQRLLRDIKRGHSENKPATIVDFIRGRGGIRVMGTDALGRRTMDTMGGPELRDMVRGMKTRGIVTQGGMSPDDMRVAMIDEAYLPVGASIDDMLAAIDDTLKGRPRFSEFDAEAAAYARQMEELKEDLDQAGLNVKDIKPEELEAFLRGSADAPTLGPAARAAADEAQRMAKAFDELQLRVEDLDAFLRSADDFAPEVAELAKSLRASIREAEKNMRQLDRLIREQGDFTALTRAELEDIANGTIDDILGNSAFRIPGLDMIAGPRGPLKERTLKIPDQWIDDFLDNDIERVARIYTKTMAADVELAAKFGGDPTMREPLEKLRDELARREAAATSDAERTAIQRQYEAARRDVEALRDRVRNVYGMPDDPNGLAYRAAKVSLNLNYLRLLGGMTLAAIPDAGKIVFRYGLTKTFRDGFAPYVRSFSTARMAAEEVKRAGTALDMVLDTRAQAMADLMDDFSRTSRFERVVEGASSRFGLVSLMAPWNAVMKQITGTIAMSEVLRSAQAVTTGTATRKQIADLASSGIDDAMARRIWTAFDGSPGGQGSGVVRDGVYLPNTEEWGDRFAAEALRAAIVREADNVIVTPGLEKPLWTSTTLGKLLGQFKSFAFASTQKTLIAGLQRRDAEALNGVLVMLALGAFAAKIKGDLRGIDTSEWEAEKWAVEALDSSGLMSIFAEANAITEKVTRGNVGLSAITGEQISRYASRNTAGAVLGPSFGLATDLLSLPGSAMSGEWAASDTRAARRILPFQNLFYLRTLLDEVEEATNDAMGVPARRQ
jgi:hypothetical protein